MITAYPDTASESDLQARQAHVLPLLRGVNSILEVGCGDGKTLDILSRSIRLVVGIDICPTLLRNARALNQESVQADARRLPLGAGVFDAVMALEVLEHIPEWDEAVEELFRVARHRVIVTVLYQERLKGQTCPHCGTWVPLYGHLHRFAPESFAPWQDRGRMTVRTIGAPFGWWKYWQKALSWLCKAGRGSEPPQLHCPTCRVALPPGLHWQRMMDRIWRLLTRQPEWLLVVWDVAA